MFRSNRIIGFCFVAALSAGTAHADYSDQAARVIFDSSPCTGFVAGIDADLDGIVEGLNEAEWQALGRAIARQGMFWGILLGYDTAKGGLESGEQTTLMRLRLACAMNPEVSARRLLDGFAIETD